MIKNLLLLIASITIYGCSGQNKNDYLPKNPSQEVVVDYSRLFTTHEKQELTQKIINFESETTNQIVITTVDSIKPYKTIKDYASSLGSYWGVGQKEKDNGLIIVICLPIRKIFISTGFGTQKIITDSLCQKIIDERIIPTFKNGNFFNGTNDGLDEIIQHWKNHQTK